MTWEDFTWTIVKHLSDDLLQPQYQRIKSDKTRIFPNTLGHCYVASEAAYYMLGGKEEGWTPMRIRHLGVMHWFLKHKSGFILDITADQFQTPIDYSKARGCGFLTKEPSKRSKELMRRIGKVEI